MPAFVMTAPFGIGAEGRILHVEQVLWLHSDGQVRELQVAAFCGKKASLRAFSKKSRTGLP